MEREGERGRWKENWDLSFLVVTYWCFWLGGGPSSDLFNDTDRNAATTRRHAS